MMIGLIQRTLKASVEVEGKTVGEIGKGVLLFLAIEKGDTNNQVEKLLNKVIQYRIFEDESGRMNQSLLDINGGLLVVSQFTLAANTKKGLRPGFETAEKPTVAEAFYNQFITLAKQKLNKVATGEFGADMQVSLINDGPVTFYLRA